jgi:hypothetical protein
MMALGVSLFTFGFFFLFFSGFFCFSSVLTSSSLSSSFFLRDLSSAAHAFYFIACGNRTKR